MFCFEQNARYELSPAFYLCHTVNAWEEPNGQIRIYAICIETSMVDLDWARFDGTFPEALRPRLCEIVLDPATGACASALHCRLLSMNTCIGAFYSVHK